MALDLFICYAREDMAYKNTFLKQRAALEDGLVNPWHDSLIDVGETWEPAILAALERCSTFIFLVSSDFLDSQFIRSVELPRILERRANGEVTVFPIIIRPCYWERGDLGKIQVYPGDGKAISELQEPVAERAWVTIVKKLAEWADNLPKSLPSSSTFVQSDLTRLPTSSTPVNSDLTRLPVPSATLVGRKAELALLDKYFQDPHIVAVGMIALGGAGKSALTWAWLEKLRQEHFAGARVVFAWSFYSQGQLETQTSSTLFFNSALSFFGYQGNLPSSDADKADMLAKLLTRQPSLLILDGVEPLQHPPHELEGSFKDTGLNRLMRILAANGLNGKEKNSLVLLSSRQNVPTLEKTKDGISRIIKLGRLNDADGTALLKSLGVTRGLAKEFPKAVQEMEGHALALVLLGKLLVKYHKRDITLRDRVKDLFSSPIEQGRHARRVMAHYDTEIWQENAPERVFLQLLGLFDRPMAKKPFEELKEKADLAQPLRELSDIEFNEMLFNLEEAGLLESLTNERTHWDTHPLMREYFGQLLATNQPVQFRQAHRVLFEFFQTVPAKEQPDTLEELEPLYRAVHHGCKAGEYKKAKEDVLQARIHRGEEFFSIYKLGAFGAELAAMAGFFHKDWKTPVSDGLSESNQGWLLSHASLCLSSLGRMAEAVAPGRATMRLWEKLQDWENAAISAENLVDLLIPTGGLDEAREVAEKNIAWAGQAEGQARQVIGHAYHAYAWFRLGEFEKSEKEFWEAERIQKEIQPQYPRLYSLQGAQFCDLLLAQSRNRAAFEEVRERGEEAQKIAIHYEWSLDISLDHLTIGRALAALGGVDDASRHLNEAVIGIRKAGDIRFTPNILLHRAAFLRNQGEPAQAQFDLDEALEITQWSGMVIYEAEARLLEMHWRLDENNIEAAQTSLARAEALIRGDIKYPLRYAELDMARSRCFYMTNKTQQAQEVLKEAKNRIETTGHWGLIPAWEKIAEEISYPWEKKL